MTLHGGVGLLQEIAIRIIMYIVFQITDDATPFFRKIQPEEYWLYNYPRTPSYYPSSYLWLTVVFGPLLIAGAFYVARKDLVDLREALLGSYLSVMLAGIFINVIKLGVGRPRPDFLARCFPDGNIQDSMKCEGKEEDVIEGYKSFPSGHSGMSFSCLAFMSLYIAGKFHCFSQQGRGKTLRLLAAALPLVWGTCIAVSRTADYHHHWQDVTVGTMIGITVAYLCYRQYYPPIQRHNSHLPYVSIAPSGETEIHYMDRQLSPTSPLLPLTRPDKLGDLKAV